MSVKDAMRGALKATLANNTAFISRQSAPGTKRISVAPTAKQYISPTAGYLWLRCKVTEAGAWMYCFSGKMSVNKLGGNAGQFQEMIIPCAKGATLNFDCGGAKMDQIVFFSLFGGDKKPYISISYDFLGCRYAQ